MCLENIRFKDYRLNEFHNLRFTKFKINYFPLNFLTIIASKTVFERDATDCGKMVKKILASIVYQ
ncbi:hypothetical protein BpHYR1_023343 [Brachionus plicatilis]|uniref:Uncharacterized protein n=1 Tax=Brachionus plicatilis TaxID=10195 RepID=A0A3M7SRY2_BRAPC|nr:hypothetical protein BpHYR1_023343 [Brachionus plicatilis]